VVYLTELITVFVSNFLQEFVVLIDSCLLIFDIFRLGLQNFKQTRFADDLLIFLKIFKFKLVDVVVTFLDDLGVGI
jgi:hypothetical protein